MYGERNTYCIFKLMSITILVNVILPMANIELSSEMSVWPYNPSMIKYTIIASAQAMNTQPK